MKNQHLNYLFTFMSLCFCVWCFSSCSKETNEITTPEVKPPLDQVTIAYLKDLSSTPLVTIKDSGVIRGVVISDAAAKNIDNAKTLFIQEGSGKEGLMLRLKTDHNFKVNDSLEVEILNQTLANENGAVVMQEVPNNLVKKVGIGKIIPRETSVIELKAHKIDWEGSLVRIKAAELLSASGNYGANTLIRDGQASISAQIFEAEQFKDTALPNDVSSILGIVRLNGTEVQLAPQNIAEIRPLTYVTDDFTTWKNTTWNFNLAMVPFALFTNFANWQGNILDGAVKQMASTADASFTKAGKIYPYLPKDSIASSLELYANNDFSLKGLKVIKITFAASGSSGEVKFMEQSVGNKEIAINVLPFSEGTDVVKVGIELPIESTGEAIPGKLVTPKGAYDYYRLVSLTPAAKEAGKFYTALFFIPSTLEDLSVMGSTSSNRQQWLDRPWLKIINLSSRKTVGITSSRADRYIPILIDKIEMGF
jgi:hypothetical protein